MKFLCFYPCIFGHNLELHRHRKMATSRMVPFIKLKKLYWAMKALGKSFQLTYSNIQLNSRETVPLRAGEVRREGEGYGSNLKFFPLQIPMRKSYSVCFPSSYIIQQVYMNKTVYSTVLNMIKHWSTLITLIIITCLRHLVQK